MLDSEQPNLARFVFTDPRARTAAYPDWGRIADQQVALLKIESSRGDLFIADEQRLLVCLPADEAASAALDQLTGRRSGALRVVTG